MESKPEFLNKKRNSILEQEDEAFIQSKNNKKLENKLNFAENELDDAVIKSKEKNSNMAIKSLETRMKNAKKAGDIDKFNSLKNKYLKLMEMEQ